MRFKGLITLLFLILTAFGVTSFAQDQGENFMSAGKVIVSLQLAAGQVRVADTNGQVPSIFFPYDQNGLELGASYGLSNHWAVSLSGNLGFSSYKNEYPDTIVGVPAKIEDKVKSSTWGIRGGLDCYIQVSDKFVIFAGPGLMFNRAKINHEVKIEPDTLPFFPGNDNPWTNSISLSGRLGGLVKISNNVGFSGSFGQEYSYSWWNVNSGGTDYKWKWWTSSLNARMGLIFYFGGS